MKRMKHAIAAKEELLWEAGGSEHFRRQIRDQREQLGISDGRFEAGFERFVSDL